MAKIIVFLVKETMKRSFIFSIILAAAIITVCGEPISKDNQGLSGIESIEYEELNSDLEANDDLAAIEIK